MVLFRWATAVTREIIHKLDKIDSINRVKSMHFTSQVCPPLPLAADSSPSTAAQTALLTVKFPAVPRREIMSSYPELSEPA